MSSAQGSDMYLGWPQVGALSRFLQFGVRVSIQPGEIVCSTTVVRTRLTLRHCDEEVTITHALLMPPGLGMRTQLTVIGDQGARAQIAVWWGIRSIREALDQAGFTVRDQQVWLPPAGNWPPLNTIVRFRRAD